MLCFEPEASKELPEPAVFEISASAHGRSNLISLQLAQALILGIFLGHYDLCRLNA